MKSVYIKTYVAELKRRYEWAQDASRLAKVVEAVENTLFDRYGQKANLLTGESALAAWRAIGGKGKPTYKALRALPA